MDGVLVDTEPVWTDVEIAVFATVGLHLTEEMTADTRGLRTDAVVAHWFARHPWPNHDSSAILDAIFSEMDKRIRQHVRILPGVERQLKFLTECGLPLAIASSSPLKLIHAVLDSTGFHSYFNVLCSAEFEEHGKPAPDVYLAAARKLGVANDQCLVFEDSLNGVLSATRAGMICVAVNPDPDVKARDAAAICLKSLEEFSGHLFQELSEGSVRHPRQ